MFRKLVDAVRRWMYKMGLIKGLKEITEYKDIAADEEHYQRVAMWQDLYRGYYEPWHRIEYHTVQGKKARKRHSLRMPKVVSEEMARLVFNEKCRINISDETLATEIERVFKRNSFYKRFQDFLEYNYAMGGMVMKAYAQPLSGDGYELKISFTTADCFLPISHQGGKIIEGAFISQTRQGNKYYTLIESHRWTTNQDGERIYLITNELFESDKPSELGVKASPAKMKELYPGLEAQIKIKNLTRPLFVYVKPNIANNFDPQSPLGISIFANALDTLKALDIAFDSFIREFSLGKKRILVPATAIQTVVDPRTGEVRRYFDAEDEVYQAFNFADPENQKIQDMSVELRVDEHVSAIQALLDILAMQIGFSPGAFTFDGQGVKTATEVVSENSKTYRTKNSHELLIEEALKEFIECLVQVGELYGVFNAPQEYDITIDFDDSIAQDRDANADYYLKLKNAGLISARTALMRILDLTEEQAEEELRRIAEESPLPSVDNLFSGES